MDLRAYRFRREIIKMCAFGNKWLEEPTEDYTDSYRKLMDYEEILCDICGYYYATHEEDCDGMTYDVCDEPRCLNAMEQCRDDEDDYPVSVEQAREALKKAIESTTEERKEEPDAD